MIKKYVYGILFGGAVACGSPEPNHPSASAGSSLPTDSTTLAATSDSSYISINLKELPDAWLPAPTVVEVAQDHSRRARERYEAYPLRPILDKLIARYDLDTTASEVVLVCKDGYLASNTLSELYTAEGGYLAFRDLDAPAGQDWPDSLQARYAPFYLVWKDIPYDDHRLTWPYGLVALRFSTGDPYASLYPHDRPELAKAFAHYRNNCLKCHSLNRIGGSMGPEFNVPKNITEYWTRDNIVAFAQNPQSFRYNSQMYAITHLSEDELHSIVDYLMYMTDKKE